MFTVQKKNIEQQLKEFLLVSGKPFVFLYKCLTFQIKNRGLALCIDRGFFIIFLIQSWVLLDWFLKQFRQWVIIVVTSCTVMLILSFTEEAGNHAMEQRKKAINATVTLATDVCFFAHTTPILWHHCNFRAFSRHRQPLPGWGLGRAQQCKDFPVVWSDFFVIPQLASSTLLQLGQNVEKMESKNRESVYLLLHMVGPRQYCNAFTNV